MARKIDDEADKGERLKLKAIPETAVLDIKVSGVGDLLTRLGNCCNPVPGDQIVGYITRGKGVTVHRTDCPNVLNMQDTERLIPVSWGDAQRAYPVVVRIEAFDRSGLLRDVAAVVADLDINMISASVSTNKDHTATIVATMGIKGVSQLATLLGKLQGLRDVIEVQRETAS